MSRSDISTKANTIIAENLANPQLSVEFLAEKIGVSNSHLYESIYFTFDMPPQGLIETLRLEVALELLVGHNRMTIIQICKLSGYSNSKTFRNAFKKRFGVPPSNLKGEFKTENEKEHQYRLMKDQLWEGNCW